MKDSIRVLCNEKTEFDFKAIELKVGLFQTRGNVIPMEIEYPQFVGKLFDQKGSAKDELMHASAGLSGEAGEVLDIVKKVWAYDKELDLNKVVLELGDLRFYYQAMINAIGVTDYEIMVMNMDKLNKRFSSGEFSKEAAIKQADSADE